MEIEKDTGQATYQIQTYKERCIIINNQEYRHSIAVMPEELINPWGPDSFDGLSDEHFQILLPYKPQVVLLGTGKQLHFPPSHLYSVLTNHKIGVEVMDTAAACRTYQILMTEGRHVVAALIC
jgi:uncharacterized protein